MVSNLDGRELLREGDGGVGSATSIPQFMVRRDREQTAFQGGPRRGARGSGAPGALPFAFRLSPFAFRRAALHDGVPPPGGEARALVCNSPAGAERRDQRPSLSHSGPPPPPPCWTSLAASAPTLRQPLAVQLIVGSTAHETITMGDQLGLSL